jgi:hypothetical protein
MLPWTRIAREPVVQAPAPEEALAPETLARLAELRARFDGHPEWMELTMDQRRLAFARWLVECGRLSDDS